MAFLSLGLNNDQQTFREENAHSSAKEHLNGNGNGNGSADKKTASRDLSAHNSAQGPTERTDETSVAGISLDHGENANGNARATISRSTSATPASTDNWPETGMEIIQRVLREAQSKSVSVATTEVVAESSTVLPPETSAKNGSALPREIEELREQISQGITPTFRVEPKQNAEPGSPPLTLAQNLIAPPEPDGSLIKADAQDSAATLATNSLSAVMEEIRKLAQADKSEPPVTPASTGQLANSPTWMSKLASDNDNSTAQSAPEMLLPVMEEFGSKLAADSGSIEAEEFDEARATTPVPEPSQSGHDVVPSFATFKFGYLPGRGLLYSIIGHEVAMFGLFLLITYVLPTFREQRLIVGSVNNQDHVIFLPEIGGGEQGQKSPGGGVSKPQQASAAPARASKGFAYPGAQAILSDPPNPTNAFQTVLHPLMVHPEPLKKLVPLPNIVQMAEMRLPSDLVAPKLATPHYQPPPTPIKVKQDGNLHRDAKWNVPVKAPQLLAKAEMPKLAAAEQPLPDAPKVQPKPKEQEQPREQEKPAPAPLKVSAEKRGVKSEKQVAPPSAAQIARLEMHGKAPEPLLSLSPAPLPPGTNVKIPAGEARGRFAIAPGGTLNPKVIAPGKPNGTYSESAATGQEKSQSANAATELASNTGTGAGHNSAAGGGSGNANAASGGGSAGAGSGSGNTAGVGVGGNGTGNGRGTAGNGAGRSGQGAGTGAGAGSGAGSGAFPGITIQGGEGNEGASDSQKLKVEPQTPYQITIVATASSGGGLSDYGVFENERVYTVYIPMQRTPQEADPTWTLQYALETPSADSGDGQLIAPTPVIREWPQIPPDLEKNYSQRQVVVYAVLDTDGKLSRFSVKQTPDVHVNAPITQALAKWVFRPAQLNNKPVPVKILIGIPLS